MGKHLNQIPQFYDNAAAIIGTVASEIDETADEVLLKRKKQKKLTPIT
jgi:hypothetical protein